MPLNLTSFIYVFMTNMHHNKFISLFMLTLFNSNAWKCYMQFKYININFQSKYFVCIMVVLVSLKNVDLKTNNCVTVENLTLKVFHRFYFFYA